MNWLEAVGIVFLAFGMLAAMWVSVHEIQKDVKEHREWMEWCRKTREHPPRK